MILKYLLDTCAISEVVKTNPNKTVLSWINRQADVDLYLSVLTVGEIRKGIEAVRPTNPDAARKHEAWLDNLVALYADRILPFDVDSAQTWGALLAQSSSSDVEDSQIAAIALTHGMTVVTRNVADFQIFNVPIHDPF